MRKQPSFVAGRKNQPGAGPCQRGRWRPGRGQLCRRRRPSGWWWIVSLDHNTVTGPHTIGSRGGWEQSNRNQNPDNASQPTFIDIFCFNHGRGISLLCPMVSLVNTCINRYGDFEYWIWNMEAHFHLFIVSVSIKPKSYPTLLYSYSCLHY